MATDGWLSTIGSHRVIVVRRRLSCCDFMVYLSVGIVIRGQTSINFHLGVGNGWRLLGCNNIVFQSLNATQFLNDVGINQYSLNSLLHYQYAFIEDGVQFLSSSVLTTMNSYGYIGLPER